MICEQCDFDSQILDVANFATPSPFSFSFYCLVMIEELWWADLHPRTTTARFDEAVSDAF
jgi:hypothetical protein